MATLTQELDSFKTMNGQKLDFYFEEGPVGTFEEIDFPNSNGEYRYMPYRSINHLKLITALKSKKSAHCHYVKSDNSKVIFEVTSTPGYGKLILRNFVNL